MTLVECVPNFSEGRRAPVITAIRDAIAALPGVTILDVSSDASHNRTVVTFVAEQAQAVAAQFAGIRVARDLIDLTRHTGEHPRIGAADVVPFVPLEGTSMAECVSLARELGERVGRELEIPVFLYERAATRADRENLADLRRGGFEGLAGDIGRTPQRTPDYGPSRVHPTAGAVAIGARPFLVAYNVYLGPATNLAAAKQIAKAVRGSSGGLRYVKALGLEVDGQAQVSMNLVDLDATPLFRAYEMVKGEAEALGLAPTWSEIIGLVPERALVDAGARHVRLAHFSDEQLLERRLRAASRSSSPRLEDYLAAIAAPTPAPGGGAVVAHTAALAAALAQMVAGLTVGRKKYAAAEAAMKEIGGQGAALVRRLRALADEDAAAYTKVSDAYTLPKEPVELAQVRTAAIDTALVLAAQVPLETARAAREVARLAVVCADRGNQNAVSDAAVAALLAEAACRGAVYNVRINVAALSDPSLGSALAAEAVDVARETSALARTATAVIERALGTR